MRSARGGVLPTKDNFVQRSDNEAFFKIEERPRSSGVQTRSRWPCASRRIRRRCERWRARTGARRICVRADKPTTVYLTFPAAQKDVHTQVIRLVLQSLFLGRGAPPASRASTAGAKKRRGDVDG